MAEEEVEAVGVAVGARVARWVVSVATMVAS